MFPGNISVVLVGVTFLFAIAQANGTVDWLVQLAVRGVRTPGGNLVDYVRGGGGPYCDRGRQSRRLGAPLDRIEQGKHFVPKDHPEEVAAVVNELLEQTAPDQ